MVGGIGDDKAKEKPGRLHRLWTLLYLLYLRLPPPKGIDIIITITTKWRVGRVGSSNCSNCLSALYLSILQLTLLALHTFKAL